MSRRSSPYDRHRVGFERARVVRDVLLGFALIPASLVFILGGNYLRFRRLMPLAIAHALMDGASVLLPLLTA